MLDKKALLRVGCPKFIAVLLLFSAGTTALEAGCPPKRTPRNKVNVIGPGYGINSSSDKYKYGDIMGSMRRLEDDIKDVEKKLGRAEEGSQKRLNLQQERDKLSLEMIHTAQTYFFEKGSSRNDGRTRKLHLLLQNECNMLQKTLKEIPDFPFPDRMHEISQLLLDIRSGKERYSGKIPRSNQSLLREIQKNQRELLKEFQKEQRKNRPRGSKKG